MKPADSSSRYHNGNLFSQEMKHRVVGNIDRLSSETHMTKKSRSLDKDYRRLERKRNGVNTDNVFHEERRDNMNKISISN